MFMLSFKRYEVNKYLGVFIGKSCYFLNINTVQMFCLRLAIEITVHSSLVAYKDVRRETSLVDKTTKA